MGLQFKSEIANIEARSGAGRAPAQIEADHKKVEVMNAAARFERSQAKEGNELEA